MADLMPSDIVDEVRAVLLTARRGKGDRPNLLTAFQILDRLPEGTRTRLINERTGGGIGAGIAFAAPSVVSKAARLIIGVVVEYMDCVGLSVQVAGQSVVPSFEVCGLYRLAPIDVNAE
jgi:hypothetical protein